MHGLRYGTHDMITSAYDSYIIDDKRDDVRVLKEVFRVLKPWGRILIDVAVGEYPRT